MSIRNHFCKYQYLEIISNFQENLLKLNSERQSIQFKENEEEHQIRNIIVYFLNSFKNYFDIGITRLIESKIGMA